MSDQIIIPSEWRVMGSFVHDGLTYSPGAPPPEMTLERAMSLERTGIMVRPRSDGSIPPPPVPTPKTPADYLRNNDVMLLRALKQFPPSVDDMVELMRQAVVQGRSDLLRTAMDLVRPAELGSGGASSMESIATAVSRAKAEVTAELNFSIKENETLSQEVEQLREANAEAFKAHREAVAQMESEQAELKRELSQLREEADRLRSQLDTASEEITRLRETPAPPDQV